MTVSIFPNPSGAVVSVRGKYSPAPLSVCGAIGGLPLPTDPLFTSTLTLNNVVANSRYRVTRTDTGAELATGVATAGDNVLTGINCFANPQQVNITVRYASGATKYKVFDTSAYIPKAGVAAYILQQVD